jgi:hypothetical protein
MSNLIESLATDRHAARYEATSRGRRSSRLTPAPRRAEGSRLARIRSSAGWLLIGIGLRLAMRGGDSPARRTSLLGR